MSLHSSVALTAMASNKLLLSHYLNPSPSFHLLQPRKVSFLSHGRAIIGPRLRPCRSSINGFPTAVASPHKIYEFSDGPAEVELRMPLRGKDIQNSRDVFLDVNESTLSVNLKSSGLIVPLLETIDLYARIKPSETIWYIDEDELVVNLKKVDSDLKWPDIKETWESLAEGVTMLLKGASVYVVGESTEMNQKVAMELAKGLRYTHLDTAELLESVAKKSLSSWLAQEGSESVAQAESAVLESLSSHVRAVVATLGGSYGAAGKTDMWRHLHAGFSVWISQSEASDELSAIEEARRNIIDGSEGYTKADVVVKLSGWDPEYAQIVAQSCLSAFKQLILSEKNLPGKKCLYIRLGCRGDWPNIKPPGWDPSSGQDVSPES